MGKWNVLCFASAVGAAHKADHIAAANIRPSAGQRADPDFRPLQVLKDADCGSMFAFDCPDAVEDRLVLFMTSMAEV
jgi:hypothetical protein